MNLVQWRKISRQYLEEFSSEELYDLLEQTFIPKDLSTIPRIELSQFPDALLRTANFDLAGCQKLPESFSHFYIQSPSEQAPNGSSGQVLIFFKRLDTHPNWYVIDIIFSSQYKTTFLVLDIEPVKELFDTATATYYPVCHLLSKRPSISDGEAYLWFKKAHFLLLYALTYCV